jgi:FtsH-binding integral membrane protein
MEGMSDPILPHGQLPPIPEGCGILPIAENRIARGPRPELLDALPESFSPVAAGTYTAPVDSAAPILNDALEQSYRRVLARALALAAGALLLTAAVAASLVHSPALSQSFFAGQLIVRAVFVTQVLFIGFCSRHVEKLGMVPAAALLFSYAAFCAMEFSALLSPATLAVAFLCAGLMYAVTALWGFVRGSDLARPVTAIFMILAGGLILAAVNLALRTPSITWSLSSVAVVIFAGLASYHAQQIRDFYQEFDDDNAEGWKASVLGALLLLVNSVNLYLLVGSFLERDLNDDQRDSSDRLPR